MPSTLLAANRLTDQQTKDVQSLQQLCQKHDGIKASLFLENTLNFYDDMPCFYLLYEDAILLGVLTVFAPMKLTAEISAYVLPQFRRQGHFKRMLMDAVDTLRSYGYETVILVHEYRSADAKAMIERWPVALEHTEYLLVYSGNNVKQQSPHDGIAVRQMEQCDLKEIAALSGNIFEDSAISDSLTYKSFHDPNVRYYCAVLSGKTIGVCSVRQTEKEYFLYGFGVALKHRGNGYGRAFLYDIIDRLKDQQKEILLEVDSSNKSAFTLYTSSGFAIRTQLDYYQAGLDDIAAQAKE